MIFEAYEYIINYISQLQKNDMICMRLFILKGGISMYRKAALKFKNIMLLIAGTVLAIGTADVTNDISWLSFAFGTAGVAAYVVAVVHTINSSDFKEEFELSEKLDDINKLSWECSSLYRRISGSLGKNQRMKAIGVLKQKKELMDYFNKYNKDPIKQKIIQQALKLVAAYLNLVGNYSDRMRELSQQNINDLVSRINFNNRKLGNLKNYEAVLELTKTVEMDEKLLRDLKEEREELEMVNVRLDQIESTIVGFKHRILSSELSDPEAEEIENAINEASALDNALNEHSRNRQRL